MRQQPSEQEAQMTGPTDDRVSGSGRPPTIVLVGPCASGKSTLAHQLEKVGIEVRVCGQEHSSIRDLWRKMNPDILVALSIDLPTLRSRRHEEWPETLFAVQQQRLASAFASADLVIDTSRESPGRAAQLVQRYLREHPAALRNQHRVS